MSQERTDEESFAALLSAHRRRLGMTQEQLAGLARMGVRTIRDLEQAAARPRKASVEQLADALRLEGDERAIFERAGSARAPVPFPDRAPTTSLRRRLSKRSLVGASLATLAVLVVTTVITVWMRQERLPGPGPGPEPAPPPCTQTGSSVERLDVGACIGVDKELATRPTTDASGARHWYVLTLQQDFNLVLRAVMSTGGRTTSSPIWATATVGCGKSVDQAPGFAMLRPDGNLVLYSRANIAVWASDTRDQRVRSLSIQPDGNLVLRGSDGKAISDRRGWRAGCRIEDCGNGWFCFYSNPQFHGRRTQFSDPGLQELTEWRFDREATSWVNNTDCPVDVFDDVHGGGSRLWREEPHSQSVYVGRDSDNRARSFRRVC